MSDHSHHQATDGPESAWVLDRRGFLKASGFAVTGVAVAGSGLLAGCAPAPVQRAVPLLHGVEGQVPGVAQWYASTCAGCSAGCGVLTKVRDGRPIKMEGLPAHPLSKGGLCAIGQAQVLGLYDSHRLRTPQLDQKDTTWAAVDARVAEALTQLAATGGALRILSKTITSPTTRALVERLLARHGDARLIEYDPSSSSAIREAHQRTHAVGATPHYRFERAKVICAFDADFLGTWLSPVEFTAGYRAGRNPDASPGHYSQHIQIESRMTLTGANADVRQILAPDGMASGLAGLLGRLAKRAGVGLTFALPADNPNLTGFWDEVADALWNARGESLVLCGTNDLTCQLLTNGINELLGNYGQTLDLGHPSLQQRGDDTALATLLDEISAGSVGALLILDGNPVAELPAGDALAAALKKLPLALAYAERRDETAAACTVVCPRPHALEAWSDSEPVAGTIAVAQPALQPLFGARPVIESLAAWIGEPGSALDLIQTHWQTAIHPRSHGVESFQMFWDETLSRGFAEVAPLSAVPAPFDGHALDASSIAPASEALQLLLHPALTLGDGAHAHNPWLQECPDPISKLTWDNVAAIAPELASSLGVSDGDVVSIALSGASIALPVLVQAGQHPTTIAVALGYGRLGTERFAEVGPKWLFARSGVGSDGRIGVNAAPLLALADGRLSAVRTGVTITPTGEHRALAKTQHHDSLDAAHTLLPAGAVHRPFVKEVVLADLPAFGHEHEGAHHPEGDLWTDDHANPGPKWGMVIDLNACTGCSGCVVACQAENNIPVVGKDEVIRSREMHWLRIDRYYGGDSESPTVGFEPMLCQQCGNAPCETVCPVLATVHSEDGLNQQIYNRCVGTRYCANNCPYKTRRFNWFDYPHTDPVENLVLNPDVTVRSRGVMEKCTFCVQRIQEARLAAKARGEAIPDGAIQPACQQSCPAKAITFGDMNDPLSAVSRRIADPRQYQLLAELNVKPSVTYLAIVRNPLEQSGGLNHG